MLDAEVRGSEQAVSRTPDIQPLEPRRGLRVLNDLQLALLQEATLTLLEEVGVHVPSARALTLLADHGARVLDDGVVRLPADLVRRAMASAPRAIKLAGRQERLDLILDGERSYVTTEGVGVHVVDPETRRLRASCKDDVARMARVCDALPLVAFFWPPVSAQDHGVTAPLHECHAGLTNTLKHVRGATTVRPYLARSVVEMATIVAGGEEQRRRRPPICGNICTISPLAHDEHGLECAMDYAEAGIPQSFMAMPTMGSLAPATPLGALVQGDAEVVSGMVIAQLAAPGAPVMHSVLVSVMNPHSGGYLSKVPLPLEWMATELAHAWGVPSLAGGSLSSDDAGLGWLAGARAGLGAAEALLCGSELCGYIGMTGGTMVLYPEQVVLQHEALLMAAGELGEFQFDPADVALDVIAEVGPRGHFLKHRHTRRGLRKLDFAPWLQPQATPPAAGPAAGTACLDDLVARASGGLHPGAAATAAREEYRRIAAEHHPEPLPSDVLAELEAVLAAADREVERRG